MSQRCLASLTALAVSIVMQSAPAAGQTPQPAAKSAAKPAASKAYVAPRTPDGAPDLQGYYSNASTVPFERPANLGAKEFYTPEEFANKPAGGGGRGRAAAEEGALAVHYDTSQFGLNNKVNAPSLRTSQVTGPEGKVPALVAEAQARLAAKQAAAKGHQFDGAETRPLAERCIIWPHEGPPMIPAGYNANLEIVQGPGYVAIVQEMIHDTRIIPTDGRAHLPSSVRLLQGDPVGHWEGETLVIDTTNFTDRTAYRNSSENLHVIEKLTRVDAETVKYEFTLSDPHTWAQPWSAEIPMTSVKGPIYEYACHEGNYGMANILSGVRATEAAEAAKKK